MKETLRIPPAELIALICLSLEKVGLAPDIADIEARLAVEADLHGVPSHGSGRIPGLLAAIKEGRVNPRPDLRITSNKLAVCMMDCDHGPGRWTSHLAMAEAMNRAGLYGIGTCLARDTTHWGRAHAYAAQAAQAGMIGICTTNAMTSMTGWGASTPILGNNPLAIGAPGPDEEEPIVLDMAMSQAAVGKVATWLREGKEIPDNWGVDNEGRPSRDPAAILKGAVLPMGGHKGAGLALMMQILSAVLAGGMLDHELRLHDASGSDSGASKLFIALDVAAFGDPGQFRQQTAGLLAWLADRAGTKDEGFQWPGQRGWREAAINRRLGVPLHPDIVDRLRVAGILSIGHSSKQGHGVE